MLSRALRQRLGDLAREAKPPRGAARPSAPAAAAAACASLPLFLPGERLVESVGIEEVLPGGILEELARLAREFDFLVTFNGKSFDVPFLRDRATHHRMGFSLELPHLDLLWMARRRWKHMLPDCRLKTLEWHVLRRRRAGDVSGAEIPGLYHDFVKRGQPHRLLPVFHHNLLDVVAMAELIPPLFDPD